MLFAPWKASIYLPSICSPIFSPWVCSTYFADLDDQKHLFANHFASLFSTYFSAPHSPIRCQPQPALHSLTQTVATASQPYDKMVPIARPPEVTLAEWEASGQLQAKSWMARLDEYILHQPALSDIQIAKLDPYCTTTDQNGESCMEQSGFKALLRQFVPDPAGIAALDAATPVLWRMFVYISRYPFDQPPPPSHTPQCGDDEGHGSQTTTMTRSEFLRALVLLRADLSDRLFNGDCDERTRGRTHADHRRLLFQGLSTTTTPSRPAHDDDDDDEAEALWRSKAALRAGRYWESNCVTLQTAHAPHNMGVNRDGDGDECFHDVLDFMYALQPWELCGAPVARRDFLGTAKGLVARGELVVTPLRAFRLARGDFEKLVAFLLVTYLEGSDEGFRELPRDFGERKDKVVGAFFGGGADGKDEIDFLEFDEALSAGTSEIIGGEDIVTNEFVSILSPVALFLPCR